ncbi:hypothetical protein [Paraburkholderia strydomiana]|uniref:hypothetical protein n=1 Tax=Paraburkholderia strydomiana TaxID=1245417 RepID=UPI0038B977B3
MSKLLINEHPLQVLPSLAVQIGLNEAIVLQQIHYWVSQGKNEINGHRWVFNSVADWKRQFPFWSEQTIRRTIASLKERGLLIAECLSQDPFNRTPYYRVDHEALVAAEHSKLEPTSDQRQNEITVGAKSVETVDTNLEPTVDAKLEPTSNTETISETISETNRAARHSPENPGPVQGDLLGGEQPTVPAKKVKPKATANAWATESHASANPETDPIGYLLSRGVTEQKARDWIKVRKDKGAKSLTVSAIETIESEARAAGISFVEAIKIAAGEQWRGFKASWYLKDRQNAANSQRGGYQTKQDRIDAENARNRAEREERLGRRQPAADVTPIQPRPMLPNNNIQDVEFYDAR